ncbi:hypothetical protein RI570_04275 [Brucella pseudogrignonensis]|uniref:hypothetical protein n=1 Tax=Brucella TaxID=234 RepID=UPI00084FB7E6|nr:MULTISPECIES: hypothetical protein [Brucella]MDT6939360.1 hypothetical protein [Brucella pseudogrignonensis]OEI84751.1 hypothetical protein BA060_01535 [Brucella sp. B13-0095]QMV26917.1 hypothetical protein GRI33_08340 [Brucella sp. BO3]
MNLEIRSIVDPGQFEKERVTFRAKANLDIGDFLFAQAGYANGSPTMDFSYTYWFPYKAINKGDLVVLYTKAGEAREKPLTTGKTAHFFYWDIKKSIWRDLELGAVLLNAPNWVSKQASELSE